MNNLFIAYHKKYLSLNLVNKKRYNLRGGSKFYGLIVLVTISWQLPKTPKTRRKEIFLINKLKVSHQLFDVIFKRLYCIICLQVINFYRAYQ